MPRFFADASYDFMGQRWRLAAVSTVLAAASLVVFAVNIFARGSMLNYGTDFRGGSEVTIEFSRAEAPARIRAALEGAGHRGAEVVSMKDPKRAHVYLLRVAEVSAYGPAQMERAKKEMATVGEAKLKKFDHPEEGDKVFVAFDKPLDPAAVTQAFARAGVAARDVQPFGRAEDHTFQVTLGGLDAELRKVLDARLGAGAVKDVPQVESVGAKVGKQLRADGAKSGLYTLALIMLYVWFRFDLGMGAGGVIALLHDVIIVTGLFSLMWREFTLQVLAALMTIAGYSINDTIVVFDRVRENLAKLRDRKLPVLVNTSINETLSRTTLTSLTTLFTTLAVFWFTRGPVRDFALAMSLGIVIGTYSSIFVASPIYLWVAERTQKKKA